jgi:hypothetical protein
MLKMERTLQLISVRQADLAQVTLLPCQNGEIIITPLFAVMRRVFQVTRLLRAHLQSM